MKKKRYLILLLVIAVAVISIWVFLRFPTNDVWDIAELIRNDEDFPAVWISDSQHHFHFIGHDTEAYSDAIQTLNESKIYRKSIREHTFGDSKNMIVLENPAEHTVQYFMFNDDFTMVWAVDNSWIPDHSEITQYEEICPVYRVKNPWKIKRFFKAICASDTKYDFPKDT